MDEEQMCELRGRVIKLEADHSNLKDQHIASKSEFAEFKKEVMQRFEELANDILGIRLVIAKYLGIGLGALFVLDLGMKIFFK